MWIRCTECAEEESQAGESRMRVLYIAPRFHTNQADLIRGWMERGDEVRMLVRYVGKSEDHSMLTPDLCEYSRVSIALSKGYRMLRSNDENSDSFLLRFGIPSAGKIREYLKSVAPDLVILREKSLYSLVCYRECRKQSISALTYNQSPLYHSAEDKSREDPLHRYVDRHMPTMRITPVRYKNWEEREKCTRKEANDWFVPFIVAPHCAPKDRDYCCGNMIRILEVGKFERRKNHLLMVRAFQKVYQQNPRVRLIIAGEVSNSFHEAYYKEVMQYIHEQGLDSVIQVKCNVPYEKMGEVYRESDVYVLSSSGEPAAYSILEAMSYGIPAISSSENGTADYTLPGKTGEIFLSGDEADLAEKLAWITDNPDRLIQLGQNAYRHIRREYSFSDYLKGLKEIPGIHI